MLLCSSLIATSHEIFCLFSIPLNHTTQLLLLLLKIFDPASKSLECLFDFCILTVLFDWWDRSWSNNFWFSLLFAQEPVYKKHDELFNMIISVPSRQYNLYLDFIVLRMNSYPLRAQSFGIAIAYIDICSNNGNKSEISEHFVDFIDLLEGLGFLLLYLDFLQFVIFGFFKQFIKHIVGLFIIRTIANHSSELAFDLLLSQLRIVGINDQTLQYFSKFFLLSGAESSIAKGRNGFKIHQGFFKLILFVNQQIFPQGIAIKLFLIACSSMCILLRFFLPAGRYQLFCLCSIQLDLHLQLSFSILKILDLSFKKIDLSLNDNLFVFFSLFDRGSCHFWFLVFFAKEPVHEGGHGLACLCL